MKLLLRKNIDELGIVGDVVTVKSGYARNYLLPRGLAVEPTQANIRALSEARKVAELERAQRLAQMKELGERVAGTEITIHVRANEEGVLYGSVGSREIAAALVAEGLPVEAKHVQLADPIRHLDNVTVSLKLSDDVRPEIKVWVVRERAEGDEETDEESAGTEAEATAVKDDDGANH